MPQPSPRVRTGCIHRWPVGAMHAALGVGVRVRLGVWRWPSSAINMTRGSPCFRHSISIRRPKKESHLLVFRAFSAPTKKMGKRTLAMVVYDPAAAAAQQRDAKRARARPSADAGAVVPYDVQPIDAVPLKAIAPRLPRLAPALAIPEEPPCLRRHILPALGLRDDLPMRFIDRKRVTGTDLDAHQNRFRIPSGGALGRLRPILTPDELDAASLLHDPAPRPRRQHQHEPSELENVAADDDGEAERQRQGQTGRRKRQGRRHGGLPVRFVDLAAGASGELLLSRWESTAGTVVKDSRGKATWASSAGAASGRTTPSRSGASSRARSGSSARPCATRATCIFSSLREVARSSSASTAPARSEGEPRTGPSRRW
ncbi:hypothetical protein PVAP13_3KG264803 [Panicum virgatum]|uniref:Uncharacterized protein n=1 Tax=Panicum virgatum TaxID=38727 RepID=A0A8T0V0D8_PANVG|nr:hypothetical protein PVAP13_3KG264803 [Panicum virgatum]